MLMFLCRVPKLLYHRFLSHAVGGVRQYASLYQAFDKSSHTASKKGSSQINICCQLIFIPFSETSMTKGREKPLFMVIFGLPSLGH